MRTLAIGDIHGCYTALDALLTEVRPSAEDQLVFLGDYIDRGFDSRAVIDLLIELQASTSTVFLRGNHEVMILDAREDPLKAHLWQSYGGFDTILSYDAEERQDWAAAIPKSHWKFIENTARYFEAPNNIFVHACLDCDLDMEEQPDWLLFWEFFERIQKHKTGKRIICGHTPQRSGQVKDVGFAACVDTAAVYGGWLTCLDVTSGKFWQANKDGKTRNGSLA
jgi:serine/threonine protein phosphatase 1